MTAGEYRLDKEELLTHLKNWSRFLRRKVHLIACGGTAMTLYGVKASTKDVDFMVPNIKERQYLTKQITMLGYQQVTQYGWERKGEDFRFDLFHGNRIHTTELLESPLENGRNTLLMDFSHLYIGILNSYDLIASKLMRGTQVDFDDCLMLVKTCREELDMTILVDRFNEMILYDISEVRLRPNIDRFMNVLRENDLYD